MVINVQMKMLIICVAIIFTLVSLVLHTLDAIGVLSLKLPFAFQLQTSPKVMMLRLDLLLIANCR